MPRGSSENKILLNRLKYFFEHFKPSQKKQLAGSVKDFLAEKPEKAPRSKHLSKILDFLTQKVFKPIERFGRVILPKDQSLQLIRKRRNKMKPSLLLLHAAPKNIQEDYYACLTSKRNTKSRSRGNER